MLRDENCTLCRMSYELEPSKVCRPGVGDGRTMVVTRTPTSSRRWEELKGYLSEAGIDPDDVFLTSAVRVACGRTSAIAR